MCEQRKLSSDAFGDCLFQVIFGYEPYPLLDNITIRIDQENMRLVTITEFLLERLSSTVIDIQVDEVYLAAIFCFKPVHDGSQRPASHSPEGEEFY